MALLWKALSDPTRREILDRLRLQPRTTGELTEMFPTSRFAVMKHLAVLVEAGLVISRKQGRERWNHLNAQPLQELYERWVRPYAGRWAVGLHRLKDLAERPGGEGEMSQDGLGVVHVELEIRIAERPERVWKALVDDIGRWWPRDFYAGADPKGFILEPHLGGRMFEDWGLGRGAIWYFVTEVDPPHSLGLTGHMPAAFGGPATSLLRLVLKPDANSTLLELTDSELRRPTEESRSSLEEGWRTLLEALRRHVEAGEKV